MRAKRWERWGRVGLAAAVAALSIGRASAQSQFATVTGKITDQKNVGVPDSFVRAVQHGTDSRMEKSKADGGYSMNNLLAGTYDFIACGIPHRSAVVKRRAVKPDQLITISFVLPDTQQAERPASVKLNGFEEQSAEKVAYLLDPKSRCPVAQSLPNEKGEFEFKRFQNGDQVCIRPKDKERGEYLCLVTLTTSHQ